jgi:hypothetical protein
MRTTHTSKRLEDACSRFALPTSGTEVPMVWLTQFINLVSTLEDRGDGARSYRASTRVLSAQERTGRQLRSDSEAERA